MEDTGLTENKKIELFIKQRFCRVDLSKNISFKEINFKKYNRSLFSSDIEELTKNFSSSTTIHDFIFSLFKLKNLKTFSRIHLLIHEKGEVSSSNFEYTKDGNISKSNFTVDVFTELFNSIKKSKDRSFGEINLKGTSFDILGTFLAQELSFRFHSLIIIISRDDFLPQEREDKDFFQSLIKKLTIFLAPLVEATKDKAQEISIETSLENSIYSFQYFKNSILSYSNTDELLIDPVRFDISQNEYFLVKIDNSSFLDEADIFHQERVNLLGDLFNTLKHELSNPLFGLQLSSELLLFEDLLEDQLDFIKEINNSIKRSQNLIENFKDLYSSDLVFKDINLVELINEVLTLTKSKSRHLKVEMRSIEEQLDINTIQLNTNSSWLAQILFNFIINSAEACEDVSNPKLVITFGLKDNFLKINFLDNGPGIDVSSDANIFKPFYTTKDNGTGLGLSICKSLSSKLKGELNFIQTSKGASFDLLLPYEYTHNRR